MLVEDSIEEMVGRFKESSQGSAFDIFIKVTTEKDLVSKVFPLDDLLAQILQEGSSWVSRIIGKGKVILVLGVDREGIGSCRVAWPVDTDDSQDHSILALVSCPNPSA